MNAEEARVLSTKLPRLANLLDDWLEAVVGEKVAFTLLLGTVNAVQYISNIKRKESISILKEFISHAEKGGPDLPAHANPELEGHMEPMVAMERFLEEYAEEYDHPECSVSQDTRNLILDALMGLTASEDFVRLAKALK